MEDGESGPVYVVLRQEGEVWVASEWSRTRPGDGTYLACSDRDWQIECGIESWFVPQDEARELEEAVTSGEVVATVKVDGRGHAALADITTP